jgi:hypothetical protein
MMRMSDALHTGESWSSYVAVGAVNGANAINGTDNAKFYTEGSMGQSGFERAVTLTPAAFSVQIMNPEALQTTSGIIYATRSRNVLKLQNDSRTWRTFANSVVSYYNPRLMSAGKLALRGVHIDAVPANMNKLSDFTTLDGHGNDSTKSWNGTTDYEFSGFNPIVVYNPGSPFSDPVVPPVNLQFLVTVEWRVRFDPSNPACTTHTYYPPAPDSTWNSLLAIMDRGLHGVEDIAEKVASAGMAVGRAASVATRLGVAGKQAVPMLMA